MSNHLRLKMLLIGVIGIFVGVIGTLGVFWYNAHAGPYHGVEPCIVEGYSTGTNYDNTAMGISNEPGGGGNSYIISGAFWRELSGPWHDQGSAPSIAYPSSGQKVRMGVINYKPVEDAPGSSVVVWYEVLDTAQKVTE